MKTFVFALAIIGITLAAAEIKKEDLKQMQDIKKECGKEHNISDKMLEKMSSYLNDIPDYETLKCYPKCVLLKMNMMTEDGTFVKEEMKKFQEFDDEKHNAIMDKCEKIKGADACETAYKIKECITEGFSDAKRQTIFEECSKVQKIDETLSKDMWEHKIPYPDFQTLGCYTKCSMSQYEWFTDNGFMVDAAKEHLSQVHDSPSTYEPMLNECSVLKGADDCETAWKIEECLYTKDPKY